MQSEFRPNQSIPNFRLSDQRTMIFCQIIFASLFIGFVRAQVATCRKFDDRNSVRMCICRWLPCICELLPFFHVLTNQRSLIRIALLVLGAIASCSSMQSPSAQVRMRSGAEQLFEDSRKRLRLICQACCFGIRRAAGQKSKKLCRCWQPQRNSICCEIGRRSRQQRRQPRVRQIQRRQPQQMC